MSLIYVLFLFILFFSLLMFKTSDKKYNIITSILYVFCIIYFFDCLIALVLTYLNIKNTLLAFSIVYLITSAMLAFLNYKKYGQITYQEYYLNKKHLICFIFLILFCFTLGFFKYAGFGAVDYDINDAAVHYKMSSTYSTYLKVFDNYKLELYEYNHTMFGFYVPCGILMKILPIPHYITYNIFNTSMFCLLTVCFYVTCLEMKKDDKNNIITLFLVLMYTLAYPLNYILFGFGYLGSGILAVNLILLTWKFILKEEKKYYYLLLCLFNFGLFCSYYLFVPVIYLAQTLFIIFRYAKGKYNFVKLIKVGITTLLPPTLFGILYFIYKDSVSASTSLATKAFIIEGYSYKNLWGNFILLIPMIIYSLIAQIKKEKIDLDIFYFIFEVIYTLITLVLTVNGKISSYYYFKSYYILWLISYIFIFKLINYKEYKLTFIINYIFIIFLIILSIFKIEKTIYDKNYKLGTFSLSSEIGNIYQANINVYNNSFEFSNQGLNFVSKIPKYSKTCGIINKSSEIGYIGPYLDKMWFYAIADIVPYINHKGKTPNEIFRNQIDYNTFQENKKVKCIIVSHEYTKKNKIFNFINHDEYDTLYSDKYGELLKKK